MDARQVELWLRMTADAMRGADDAQRALGALSEGPLSPASLEAWMKLWLPQGKHSGGAGVSKTEVSDFHTMLEDWWRLLGVVPQYRYDELNKRYEELKRRLEDAEKTAARLRRALGSEGGQAEAREMLDTWENLTEQTLAAQSEWARRWFEGWTTPPGSENEDTERSK
jgi:hypothetical protein